VEKIKSLIQLYKVLPETERIIVDILRQIISENILPHIKEKISYQVPYFYGNKGLCIVWPASVKGGGIRQGVLFGIWQGYLIPDKNNYLNHGANKRIFYKIFLQPEDIDEAEIKIVLQEALVVDASFKKIKINGI
jgi:Domain of unknown function (DU1801)